MNNANDSEPMVMYEIFPKGDSWPHFSERIPHPESEVFDPLYDRLYAPPCGLALRRSSAPTEKWWPQQEALTPNRSYFLDGPITETSSEDDASNRVCAQCFRPTQHYSYYCSQCSMWLDDRQGFEVAMTTAQECLQEADANDGGSHDRFNIHLAPNVKINKAIGKTAYKMGYQEQAQTLGETTLMIRNIPSQYTPEALMREWPNEGTYDFLYLPFNSQAQRNLTYAFVNFTSPAFAIEFKHMWQKMRLKQFAVQKPLNIGFADVQGRDENLRQLKKKRLLHAKVKQCQPLVFRDGVSIPLEHAFREAEKSLSCHRYGF